MTDPWPPEAIESLRRYHALGWSAGKTGLAMGKTRNSIISKRRNLGLQSSGHPQVYFARTGGRKAGATVIKPKPLPKPVIPSEAPESRGLGMLDLGPMNCRWPFGDRDYTFCGAAIKEHTPYCEFHQGIARVGTPKAKA